MTRNFVATFLFESHHPLVDQALQVVRNKVFEEAPSLPVEQEEDEWTAPLQNCKDATISMPMKMMILGR
jgi:hypothetical protein